jgi:opacity protein-like surface antigen
MDRLRRRALVLVVGSLLAVSVSRAEAEWLADVEGGAVYEDNLSRAARASDRESDVALVASLAIGHYFQLTDATSLAVTADLGGGIYSEFDQLNNAVAGLRARLRHKFGLGAYAPWVRLVGFGGVQDYRDDVRDAALVVVEVQAGKRLHERVDVQIGYAFDASNAEGPVFDLEGSTVSAKAWVAITPDLELTLGYAARWGGVVVHRTPVPGAPIAGTARVVETFDRPTVATRIDATTHRASVGLSYAVTPHVAANLGYEYQMSVGPRLTYPNNVLRASIGYRY